MHPVTRILVLCLLVLSRSLAADGLPRPVMGKDFVKRLLAMETRSDAFYELILKREENDKTPDWKNLPRSVFDDAMEDIRVTECPGRDGDAPLYLVTYKQNFDKWYAATHPENRLLQDGLEAGDVYPPTDEEKRILEKEKAAKGVSKLSPAALNEAFFPPSLDDKVLIFLDSDGQVQWPHGGDNSGEGREIITDINGDGILERLDHTNYGLKSSRTTPQVLNIRTIEKDSRLLLAVIFNWHEQKADAANRWSYELRTQPSDELPVITLGPLHGTKENSRLDKVEVEYHWDKATHRYLGPEGKPGDHFMRLEVTDSAAIWAKIKEMNQTNGLGYALITEVPPDKPEIVKEKALPQPWTKWPKYEHHSLAGLDDEALFQWQYSGEPSPEQGRQPWTSVVFPPGLRQLTPKTAALVLAEANRTRAHRQQYRLIILEDAGPLPDNGVLVLDVQPGWSRNYQEVIWFNEKDAEWLSSRTRPVQGDDRTEWNYHRDQAGDLHWMAEVIGWLDRVRTVPLKPEPLRDDHGLTGWSDVTQIGLVWQNDANASPFLQYRREVPNRTGRQWEGAYNRMVAQTLASNLWEKTTSNWYAHENTNRVELDPTILMPESIQTLTTAALKNAGSVQTVPLWTTKQIAKKKTPLPKLALPTPATAITDKTPKPKSWEQLAEDYRSSFLNGTASETLSTLALQSTTRRREFWELMKRKFDGAYGGFGYEISTAYTSDLRDVAEDDLAHLATASSSEAEGTRFALWGGANGGKPVDGQYHLARNILAIWQETDALTRGKLMLILGLKNADSRSHVPGVIGDPFGQDVISLAVTLSPDDRIKLANFAEWCATDAVGKMDDYSFTKSQEEWLALLLSKLKAK